MIRRALVGLLAVLLVGGSIAPGAARDDEVKRRGDCDLSSEWRLIVRRETRTKLRVRYEVRSDVAGQTWSVFLSMNGHGLFQGQRTTDGDGDIRIQRYPADRDGDDVIKGAANNTATGETCDGRLVYPY